MEYVTLQIVSRDEELLEFNVMTRDNFHNIAQLVKHKNIRTAIVKKLNLAFLLTHSSTSLS
jgi:hypothetical protein